MTTYDVPDSPADPEAAALDLIVRLPELVMEQPPAELTEILQEYCTLLSAEGAFAGLSWSDAKNIAAAVSFDMCNRDDAEGFIRQRARNVLGGDGMMWDDQQGAARAEHRGSGARAMNAALPVLRD